MTKRFWTLILALVTVTSVAYGAAWYEPPGGNAAQVNDTDRILIEQNGVSRTTNRGQLLKGSAWAHGAVDLQTAQTVGGFKNFSGGIKAAFESSDDAPFTVKDAAGDTVATWTPNSSDYQNTLNIFAPGVDRRTKVSFWSAPYGNPSAVRPLSIETHGPTDEYSPTNEVTFYSVDDTGEYHRRAISWHWGPMWDDKVDICVPTLAVGKHDAEDKNSTIYVSSGNGSVGRNSSLILQDNQGTGQTWQLYKNATGGFELDDSTGSLRRMLTTSGANGSWLFDAAGTGAVKIGATASSGTSGTGLWVYSGGVSSRKSVQLWGDSSNSYMDLIGVDGNPHWSLRDDSGDVFRIADISTARSRFSLTAGGVTSVAAQGSGAINLNVDTNSGTGGVNFGDGAGNTVASIDSTGTVRANVIDNIAGSGSTLTINNRASSTANLSGVTVGGGTLSQTSGTNTVIRIAPVYNQASSTAANNDLLINRTETVIGSGTQRLISAGVGGGTYTEKFGVDNTGHVLAGGGSANHAICWKADGKTLGYCSTVVASDGTCGTCN